MLGLLYHSLHGLLSPTTLIFYGLALFKYRKYTPFQILNILDYAGNSVGIVSLFFGIWFIFWAIGFGVLHIIYGLIMHKKYK